MLINNLKIALRNLLKQKAYSLINICGLAIALASCFVILLYISDELSYDKYHKYADRIYRIVYGSDSYITATPYLLAPLLQTDFPEIEKTVRVNASSLLIRKDGDWINEPHTICADKEFFDIFSLPLVYGNAATVLQKPFSVVMTKEMAHKYFGNQEAIGKTLTILTDKDLHDLQVTGIIDHFPENSHFTADFITSMSVAEESFKKFEKVSEAQFGYRISILQSWDASSFFTYVLLPHGYSALELESKLPGFNQKHFSDPNRFIFHLQPITDIHLSIKNRGDIAEQGSLRIIYLFSFIAFLILTIACINYIILATARSSGRTKEIGLRKVVGAQKPDLIRQIMGESILTALLALPIAILLVELALPFINSLLGKEIAGQFLRNWHYAIAFIIITIAVGIFSGSYISFYLTRFQPVEIFRNKGVREAGKSYLRKGLIVSQLTLFIFMLVCSILFYRQLYFLHNKKQGFNMENLISLDITTPEFKRCFEIFKNKIKSNPNVLSVSAASDVPPSESGTLINIITPENLDKKHEMKWMFVDYDYFETIEAELMQGKTFSPSYAQESEESVILNETALKEIGIKDPIGKLLNSPNFARTLKITGIIRDFHEGSFHEKIPAMVFSYMPSQTRQVVIRILPYNIPDTIASIKKTWGEFNPEETFLAKYIEQEYDNFYRPEERLGRIIGAFTLLIIVIACLGLFGLSMFMAERRTKEIGIRKVLGASVSSIITLFAGEFSKWILMATLIASPIAYYAMNKWLQNFAYRVNMDWWIFILSGALAFAIALMTISFQAIRAATTNPVVALKYE